MNVVETLVEHRHTRDGRLVVWGGALQLPFIALCLWHAWRTFPDATTDDWLATAAAHATALAALAGSFLAYGTELEFRRSYAFTALLALLALAPFAMSIPMLVDF